MDGSPLLQSFATAIDFLFLTFSLWLGLFIVTRSPRSRVSWLAGATLWSLSASFLIRLTTPYTSSPGAGTAWWWGWSVVLAAVFWYHLSARLLPAGTQSKRSWLTPTIYFLAVNLIAMDVYTPLIFDRSGSKADELTSIGVLFPLLVAFLVAVPLLAIANFRSTATRAGSHPLVKRNIILIWVSLFAMTGALSGSLATWLGPGTAALVSDISLGIGVLLLSYGVARWNALIKGYPARRDFGYAFLAIGLVVAFYLGIGFFHCRIEVGLFHGYAVHQCHVLNLSSRGSCLSAAREDSI